ncbi:hypothetical protein J1614_005823 [Plenodomus biglobosus]|nr:hypothetical protein J1614_005823 [Plenodomus biglobosus]
MIMVNLLKPGVTTDWQPHLEAGMGNVLNVVPALGTAEMITSLLPESVHVHEEASFMLWHISPFGSTDPSP